MDELQARHRKEQRDLQSRVTQKKKAATKKTRKAVNAECEELERQLRERQALEMAGGGGDESTANGHGPDLDESIADEHDTPDAERVDTAQTSTADTTDASTPSTSSVQASTQRKPNRQKARLARRAAEQDAETARAAEEAANLPDLREKERASMDREFRAHGLREQEIQPDGHCLYAAVADQLTELDLGLRPSGLPGIESQDPKHETPGYRLVRQVAAEYIEKNPDDFEPFLEEPLFTYTHKVGETAEWGGQLELLAVARAYGVEVNVLQGDGRVEKIESGGNADKTIWLAYYRHNYGLGEHYNSLRKVASKRLSR